MRIGLKLTTESQKTRFTNLAYPSTRAQKSVKHLFQGSFQCIPALGMLVAGLIILPGSLDAAEQTKKVGINESRQEKTDQKQGDKKKSSDKGAKVKPQSGSKETQGVKSKGNVAKDAKNQAAGTKNNSGTKKTASSKTDSSQQKTDPKNGSADGVKDSRRQRNLMFDPSKATKKKKPAAPRKPVAIDFSVKGTKELTFDNMIFNIKPDEPFQIKQLTKDLIKLRKHKIRIRGYIQPGFKQHNIKKFILVRDNQDCCFGPGAALYDCMIVTLAEGQSTSFSVRPITVEGTFFLKPFRGFGNRVEAILQLKDAKVK